MAELENLPGAANDTQAELLALSEFDDDELWEVVHSEQRAAEQTRLQWLLEENADNALTGSERAELNARLAEAVRFQLRRERAADLLRRRGHDVPDLGER